MKKIGVVLTLFLVLILSVGTSFADVIYFNETHELKKYDLDTNTVSNLGGSLGMNAYTIKVDQTTFIDIIQVSSSQIKFRYTTDNYVTTNFTDVINFQIDFSNFFYNRADNYLYLLKSNTEIFYTNTSEILDGGSVSLTSTGVGGYFPSMSQPFNDYNDLYFQEGKFYYQSPALGFVWKEVNRVGGSSRTVPNLTPSLLHDGRLYVSTGSGIYVYAFETGNLLSTVPSGSNNVLMFVKDNKVHFIQDTGSTGVYLIEEGYTTLKVANFSGNLGGTSAYNAVQDSNALYFPYANSPYGIMKLNFSDFSFSVLSNYVGVPTQMVSTIQEFSGPQILEFLGFQVIQEGLGYKIVGYTQDLSIVNGVLTIPSMLGALPVTSIDPNVFENLGITELNIPSNIDINLSAFGYNDITKITIGENVDINPQIGDTTSMGDNAGFVFKYTEGGKTSGIYEFNGSFWVNTTNGVSLEDKIKLILSSEKALNRHVYKQLIGTKTVILTSEYPLNVWTANLPSVQGINSLVSQTVVPSVVALDTAFRSDASMVNALGGSAHSSNLIKVFVQNEDATDMTQLPNTSLFDLSSQFNFPSKSFGYVVQLPEGVGLDSVEVVEVDSVDQSGNIIGDALETDLEDLNSAYADYLKDNPFTEVAPFSDVTIPSMVEVGREFYNSVLPSISFLFGIFATIPYIGVMMSFILPFLLLLFILKIVRG